MTHSTDVDSGGGVAGSADTNVLEVGGLTVSLNPHQGRNFGLKVGARDQARGTEGADRG